jgi:bifunctional DNA-binding transcriptional regulator/antitoxin component of YhaV-PrlF toxin-antitoxin module
MRRHLDLHPGSRLVAREDDGRIVLEPRSRVLADFQARLATARAETGYSADESVVDELIAERRAEAAAEARELDESA